MMLISGSRNPFRYLTHFLVVSAALMSGLPPADAQSTDPPNEQAQEAQSISSSSPSSEKASEDNQQPSSGAVQIARSVADYLGVGRFSVVASEAVERSEL